MLPRLKDFTLIEQVVLALSIVLLGFLVIDPFMLERSKALMPEARKFFRTITDIGRSNWMLIPTGAAIAVALVLRKRHVGFRNSAAYGLIASTIGFVFVSIGGAGLIANLTKNIVGRARPELLRLRRPARFQTLRLRCGLGLVSVRPRHQHLRLRHGDRHVVAEGQGAALHARRLDRRKPGLDRRALLHRRRRRRDPRHGVSLSGARAVCRAALAVRAHAGGRVSPPRRQDPALARLAASAKAGLG